MILGNGNLLILHSFLPTSRSFRCFAQSKELQELLLHVHKLLEVLLLQLWKLLLSPQSLTHAWGLIRGSILSFLEILVPWALNRGFALDVSFVWNCNLYSSGDTCRCSKKTSYVQILRVCHCMPLPNARVQQWIVPVSYINLARIRCVYKTLENNLSSTSLLIAVQPFT